MADKYKGIVEIEILGELRGFKFGTASMVQLCELLGCDIPQVVKRLEDVNDLKAQVSFFYTGACQYVRLMKKGTEPTFEEVANWIDNLESDKKNELSNDAFAQYVDPNTVAPQIVGQ